MTTVDKTKHSIKAARASTTMRAATTKTPSKPLKPPKNSRDLTAEKSGTLFGVVGATSKPRSKPSPLDLDREKLIEQLLADHPTLTREKALEMIDEAGG